MAQKPKKKENSDDLITLEQVFNFDANDLMANRAGVMSIRQKRLLHQNYNQNFLEIVIIFVIIMIPFFLTITLLRSDNWLFRLIWAGIAIALPAYWLRHRFRAQRELRDAVVLSAEGEISRRIGSIARHETADSDLPDSDFNQFMIHPLRRMARGFRWFGRGRALRSQMPYDASHKPERYFLQVADVELPLAASAYWNLESWEGEYCVVYYTPNTRRILSMEIAKAKS